MKTRIAKITPELAKAWLEKNTINRPLRPTVVENYMQAYARGEYHLTHQGIAFSETGELLDGQHRLSALAQMPRHFSLDMMVTTELPSDAFKGIDQGLKRSHSDVLGITSSLAAAARYIAVIHDTSRSNLTTQYLIPFVHGIEEEHANLVGFCPKRTKFWSSAAVQAAAVMRLIEGMSRDYICSTYHALNHMEFDAMSPIAQTLFRQQSTGAISPRGMDAYCRAFKVFDPRNQNLDRIQINDPARVLSRTRDLIEARILGNIPTKKASAMTAGAKKVNRANSKAVGA
jgi:hypothetical protein